MTEPQRQQFVSVLQEVHADLSRAIHARHNSVGVTTASDIQPVRYCATCEVYYRSSRD